MTEYLELGPAPANESWAQIGTEGYHEQARKECKAYKRQLKRIWPDGRFRIKSLSHDFGTYYEVCVFYDDDHSANIAFEAEATGPTEWDDIARKELGL